MNIIENSHPGKFTGEEVELYIHTKHLVQRTIEEIGRHESDTKRQEANKQMDHFFDSNCNQ